MTHDRSLPSPNLPDSADSTTRPTKACPYCQETIVATAIKCRFCNTMLNEPQTLAAVPPQRTAGIPNNTSGMGKDFPVPEGITGWSWGAFCLGIIWAISNRVWLGFLTLIPYAGWVMIIVLGAKGREWAWQSKRWESVEEFNRVQKQWNKWGIALAVAAIMIWLAAMPLMDL